MSDVESWRARQDAPTLAAIDALRTIAMETDPTLTESIKWNAPSFALDGEDRITLGVERKGGVRAVLHRGAAKTDDGFAFDDPDGLAQWPSADRGVLKFADAAAVETRHGAIANLFSRWLEATR